MDTLSASTLQSTALVQPDTASKYSASYQAGPSTWEFEKTKIDIVLPKNSIEPAQTQWAAPIVFVSKKDGTFRFCVSYWKLNAVTKRYLYFSLRMDECIDPLGKAAVFSTLDANSD